MSNNETAASPFFANAVHELRTPIQTIIGTLELMGDTTLNPEQTEYVRQVRFSADILLALVNDLLDFSKIQSGQFKLERIPVNPSNVVEETVDLISIEAHNRGLEIFTRLSEDLPLAIYSDPTRIQQILLNFVKNAVKFTSQGYINVKLSKVENNLLFEVIDTGIGVPDEKKQLIFKEFCQADASTTRKYGGTGLGLSICKNLSALMKGEIGIKDNPEGGSIFWFSLPIDLCENPPEKFPRVKNIDINLDTKILLIDDHKLALESLQYKLKTLGLTNVDVALSGEEGLEKLRKAKAENNPFAIAFVDMIMPVMDGWRLAAEINADRNINDTKLFMLVPEGQMGSEAKMKMLDWFNGYVYKPIKYRLLIDTLNNAFKEKLDLETVEKSEQKPTESTPEKTKEVENLPTTYDCTVLVAEDHPINQKLLKTFLTNFGCSVFTANNGREAVNQVAEHPEIELIFMDIQMPELNGVEATIEIRQTDFKGIIIACTANSDEADFEMYRNNGMNGTLIKPFKKQSVKDLLDKWITVIKMPVEGELEEVEELEELEEVFEEVDLNDFIYKVWDPSDFLDTVSHDYSLAQQLIEQFINQTRTYLITAKEALYMKNIQSLSVIGHTLKGSSATISAKALSEAAKKIEDFARAMDLSEVAKHINDFSALFTKFEYLAKDQLDEWKKQK